MRRREFITLLGGAAAWPLAASAQQPAMLRIGVLEPLATNDDEAQPRVTAFEERLRELGWVNGQNVHIDYRWAPGETARIRAATELVSLKPDVIVASSTPAVMVLRAETRAIPILFVQVTDPVAAGLATSLTRPGGNITGVTNFEFSMGGKWLETLKEISPQIARVAVLYDPSTAPYAGLLLSSIAAAAPSLAMETVETPVQDVTETERAIEAFAQKSNGGLLVLPDAGTTVRRDIIITARPNTDYRRFIHCEVSPSAEAWLRTESIRSKRIGKLHSMLIVSCVAPNQRSFLSKHRTGSS